MFKRLIPLTAVAAALSLTGFALATQSSATSPAAAGVNDCCFEGAACCVAELSCCETEVCCLDDSAACCGVGLACCES